MYLCIHLCMCVRALITLFPHTHTHTYIYIYIFVCLCIHTCVCVCVCVTLTKLSAEASVVSPFCHMHGSTLSNIHGAHMHVCVCMWVSTEHINLVRSPRWIQPDVHGVHICVVRVFVRMYIQNRASHYYSPCQQPSVYTPCSKQCMQLFKKIIAHVAWTVFFLNESAKKKPPSKSHKCSAFRKDHRWCCSNCIFFPRRGCSKASSDWIFPNIKIRLL